MIRIGVKRREGGGRQLREGLALPDENGDAAASVHGITRENARPGVDAIRSQE